MALTAHQQRQLARIEADLRRDDPGLARALAFRRPRASGRDLAEILAPAVINVVGLTVLVVGALAHQIPIVVVGLFLGSGGPLAAVAAVRLVRLRRARRLFGRRAAR